MLYDVLDRFRAALELGGGRETARTYANRLEGLLEGQSVSDPIGKLDVAKVLDKLGEIKYKSYYSQSKNAFLHFCEFADIKLNQDQLDQIEELKQNTRKKYRKLEPVEFEKVNNKINHMKNQKLKLSYQTLLATGLRVSELAQITPGDCTLTDDTLCFQFIGKGGNQEETTIQRKEYPKLYERLKKQIEDTGSEKRLFYSANYLQQQAQKRGFHCHDLRRACAKLEYKKTRSQNAVQEKLRHKSVKNTNIYLRSRVKF